LDPTSLRWHTGDTVAATTLVDPLDHGVVKPERIVGKLAAWYVPNLNAVVYAVDGRDVDPASIGVPHEQSQFSNGVPLPFAYDPHNTVDFGGPGSGRYPKGSGKKGEPVEHKWSPRGLSYEEPGRSPVEEEVPGLKSMPNKLKGDDPRWALSQESQDTMLQSNAWLRAHGQGKRFLSGYDERGEKDLSGDRQREPRNYGKATLAFDGEDGLRALDRMFDRNKLAQTTTFHRGMRIDSIIDSNNPGGPKTITGHGFASPEEMVGKIVTDHGYGSVSKSAKEAADSGLIDAQHNEYYPRVPVLVMHISAPKGTKVIRSPDEKHSAWMARGTQYRINSVKKVGGEYHANAEVVGQNSEHPALEKVLSAPGTRGRMYRMGRGDAGFADAISWDDPAFGGPGSGRYPKGSGQPHEAGEGEAGTQLMDPAQAGSSTRWAAAARIAALPIRALSHAEHAVLQQFTTNFARLPRIVQTPVKAAFNLTFAPYVAAQAFAARIATERGGPEYASRVASTLSKLDIAGAKGAAMIGHYGGPVAATAAHTAYWFPLASLSYIAYSTARNPVATASAARRVVSDVRSAVGGKGVAGAVARAHALRGEVGMSAGSFSEEDAALILQAYQMHRDNQEWYEALLSAALDETSDVKEAIQMADAAIARQPAGPDADDSDADAESLMADETAGFSAQNGKFALLPEAIAGAVAEAGGSANVFDLRARFQNFPADDFHHACDAALAAGFIQRGSGVFDFILG
jgi:hypothetical protein